MKNITSYCHIKNNQVIVNGNVVFQTSADLAFVDFLSEAYKSIGISYPKFHKMDSQCKLGILCAEFVLKNSNFLKSVSLDQVAIVLSNSASSIETDRLYQASIDDKSNYFPSPAVFVYTLPNIVIGELAIKYKITGENTFFVTEKMDANLLVNYSEILLNQHAEALIGGWVEVDSNSHEAFIFLVEKEKNINKNSIFKPLNQSNINQLYNQSSWTH
jgi:hypothetical protein